MKPATIEQYIDSFPANIQERLILIRKTILETFPYAEQSIKYGMPSFKVGKEHVYVSANKKHIGMYPMYGLEEINADLKPFRGKGTKDALHFFHKVDLPVDLIKKIIIVKSRG